MTTDDADGEGVLEGTGRPGAELAGRTGAGLGLGLVGAAETGKEGALVAGTPEETATDGAASTWATGRFPVGLNR